MGSFPTYDGSALQLPHMLRARGWKEKNQPKPLKIYLSLFPGCMDILLSVHFPEALRKLLQLLWCPQRWFLCRLLQNFQFLLHCL